MNAHINHIISAIADPAIGNAALLCHLDALMSPDAAAIPAPERLALIAALRERHTTMPAGREISVQMQICLERALIQARLHLMHRPGAAEGFRVAATHYAAQLEARRALVAEHLDHMDGDCASPLGAIEWCERLLTKFTIQEIARPDLPDYAGRLIEIRDRLCHYDDSVLDVLTRMIVFLELGDAVSANAAEAVRQTIPGFAFAGPRPYYERPNRMAISFYESRS